jgi:hypothetical protein
MDMTFLRVNASIFAIPKTITRAIVDTVTDPIDD